MASSPPSLGNCPPEIIARICQQLCPHCSIHYDEELPDHNCFAEREECIYDCDPVEVSLNALFSLARTCKSLLAIVEPFLYHYPTVTRRPVSFIRKLLEHPELANQIRQLNLAPALWPMRVASPISPDDVRLFRAALQERDLPAPHWDLRCWDTIQTVDQLWNWTHGHYVGSWADDISLLAIMESSSGLQHLELQLHPQTKLPPLKNRMLPRLTFCCIAFPGTHTANERRSFGLPSLDQVGNLLMAAPRLETIHFKGLKSAGNGGLVVNDSVREIRLKREDLSEESLIGILTAFPALESFCYMTEAGWDYPESAYMAKISSVLNRHGTRLRQLKIGLESDPDPDADPDRALFREMKNLRELDLRMGCVCHGTGPSDGDLTFSEAFAFKFLVGMIPPWIQVLNLDCCVFCFQKALALLVVEASTRFPLLETIGLYEGESPSDLELVTKTSGIRLEFLTRV